jgi:hypothetical protein
MSQRSIPNKTSLYLRRPPSTVQKVKDYTNINIVLEMSSVITVIVGMYIYNRMQEERWLIILKFT